MHTSRPPYQLSTTNSASQGYVFDSKRTPDKLLHVLLKSDIVQSGNENAGPVETRSIYLTRSGLEGKGSVDAGDDRPAFHTEAFAARCALFRVSGIHGVVPQSGRVG
jgi:hypothetical protein